MSDVLVIGGTGMLAGVCDELAARGHRVLMPSRHPHVGTTGQVVVEADWSDPAALRDQVAAAAEGPIELAVVWCHRPYRNDVVDEIKCLMAPDAKLIEVLGSTTLIDLWEQRPPEGSVFVMLGHRQLDDGTSRWLTHDEISSGVIGALDRGPGSTVVVGSLD